MIRDFEILHDRNIDIRADREILLNKYNQEYKYIYRDRRIIPTI